MNTYYVSDTNFVNSRLYQDFLKENQATGNLRIRAYAANQAIPISGAKVVVSKIIDNNNVIFFEGYTDSSGLIERISLPAPKLNLNDLDIPDKTTYTLKVTYLPDNLELPYEVNMYENICVVQNVNIVPNTNIEGVI